MDADDSITRLETDPLLTLEITPESEEPGSEIEKRALWALSGQHLSK